MCLQTTTDSDKVRYLGLARPIPVHKKDHEGVLLVDGLQGKILTPLDERPEWSDGLGHCLVGERIDYYEKRLGLQRSAEHKYPEALAYEDLTWLGHDEDGGHIEIEADAEHRMEVLAAALGLDRETGEMSGTVRTEVEMSLDREREAGEVAALEEAQEQGFPAASKDGTNG